MESPAAPQFLAFIAFAPSDHLDATWLKDSLEAASRRLGLPAAVGLEDQDELIALETHGDGASDALGRSIFMVVLSTGRDAIGPQTQVQVAQFLARPMQTSVRDFLIPVFVPIEGAAFGGEVEFGPGLQERLDHLSEHWIPTLTRRADDEPGDAWARVTEQVAALMARVLLPGGRPSGSDDERWLVQSDRTTKPSQALAAARSMVAEIQRRQVELQDARERLDSACGDLVTECVNVAVTGLGRRRFDVEEVQKELTAASDGYHETLESIVEEIALGCFATERRAQAIRRPLTPSDSFVHRLDPILSDLYDKIAPDRAASDEADGASTVPLKRLSRRRRERRIGAALGMVLGPLGALVGGLIGDAVAHRRKKETLTAAVQEESEAVVGRARSSVDEALQSIADELQALTFEWQARVDVLDSVDDADGADVAEAVECSVFAPPTAVRGRSVFIQMFFEPYAAAPPAPESEGQAADAPQTLGIRVARGHAVAVHLQLSGARIPHAVKRFTWLGRPEAVGFAVQVLEDCPVGDTVGFLRVSVHGVPVGQVAFALDVVDSANGVDPYGIRAVGKTARLFEYAYVSFADDDYADAARWAHALQQSRVPFVAQRLSPALVDPWHETMLRAIDRCDLFLLCWSRFSVDSEWVATEWQRILQRKPGADDPLGPAVVVVIANESLPAPLPQGFDHVSFEAMRLFAFAGGQGEGHGH